MSVRKVKKLVTGTPAQDGAGVKLVRVLGRDTIRDFDPFLMLDAFDSTNPADYTKGFPWHPHRGIETVTYLAEGEIEHGDSLGNKGVITNGGCQWMTAGSGIIHQEMPKAAKRMLGLQFWLNLPREHKMAKPKYHGANGDQVPVIEGEGSTVRVIAGSHNGVKGALTADYVKATFLDVSLKPGAVWSVETDPEQTAFLFLLEGSASFDAATGEVAEKHAVLFDKGDELSVKAGANGAHFVLCMALPLGEPVAWGGPIAMNTAEELVQAFVELENGTFIKDPA